VAGESYPARRLKAIEQMHKAESQTEEIAAPGKAKLAQAEMHAINDHKTKCAQRALCPPNVEGRV